MLSSFLLAVVLQLEPPGETSAGTQALSTPVYAGFPAQDALSYDIWLRVDPAEGELEGSCRYRFRALEELQEIRLDSLEGEAWQVEFYGPDGAPWPAQREAGVLRVGLPAPLAAGEEVEFEARFSGLPPDGLYFRKTRYGDPIVFTDHFSVRARGWLPCEDHPADRARFALRIEAPAGYEAVASGIMSRADPEDGAERAGSGVVWSSATAVELCTYLLAFAVAPYTRVQEAGHDALVPHYIYRKDVPRARRGLRHHGAWMELCEEKFGPYPYGKYCVVQVPTRWGGMEHAGNTWVMERLFDGPQFGVGTLAHELAHQWFGDSVGYAAWHEAWLSEGFASYFGPWLHAQTGGPALFVSMANARRSWLRSRAGQRYPIRWTGYSEPDEFFGKASANTYQKGAWVLHMLRGEVGDDAFFRGVRDYYQDNAGQAVTSDAFQAAMEAASGRSLDWFFRQWLDRPGCPELEFTWSEDAVTVRQTQDGEPFRFRLRLGWTTADGEARKQLFTIEGRESVLPLDGGPIRTPVVDPDVELLYRKAAS